MRNIYNFFKRLRLSQMMLAIAVTSMLVLSTACSQSPSATLGTTPSAVETSASASRDASDIAKQELIEKAKGRQLNNPVDAVNNMAEDLDMNDSVKDAAKSAQRTLEDVSDAASNQASDIFEGAQRTIDKAASAVQ